MCHEIKKLKGVYSFFSGQKNQFPAIVKSFVYTIFPCSKKQNTFFRRNKTITNSIPIFLGVKKHIIRSNFSHERFKMSIFNEVPTYVKYFTISTKKHHISTDLKSKNWTFKVRIILIYMRNLFKVLSAFYFFFFSFYFL